MREYAILGILLMLAFGAWHIERGAVARAEVGRMADGIESKDRSIARVQALSADRERRHREAMNEARTEIAELEAQIARVPDVEATGIECIQGCRVQWPELQ